MEGATASPHIKDHYEVVGVVPGIVQARDGKFVDLTTVSLERAHELHAQKFPFLKKIEASAGQSIVEEITASINAVEGDDDVIATEKAEEKQTPQNFTRHNNASRSGKK